MQRDEVVPAEVLKLAEQSEEIVRKSGPASIPVLVLMMCASMTFYVMFMIDNSEKWLQTFMGMSVLQLLPLVVLKLKIWMAPDRLSLTPILLEKTFLMHLFVVFSRFCTLHGDDKYDGFRTYFYAALLIAGLAILHKIFGIKAADLVKHGDLGGLLGFSFMLAVVTQIITGYFQATYRGGIDLLDDTGNYADILAFVPVALLVCQESGIENFTPGTVIPMEAKQRAYYFFAFAALFHFTEDIAEPFFMHAGTSMSRSKGFEMALGAHVCHFMMLVDFVVYFLIKIRLPGTEKVVSFELAKESAGLLDAEEDEDLVLDP